MGKEKKNAFSNSSSVLCTLRKLLYNMTVYKMDEPLRALSLVQRCVYIRVCKHGCDVSDLRVFFKKYFIKAIEHFFRVYGASS